MILTLKMFVDLCGREAAFSVTPCHWHVRDPFLPYDLRNPLFSPLQEQGHSQTKNLKGIRQTSQFDKQGMSS